MPPTASTAHRSAHSRSPLAAGAQVAGILAACGLLLAVTMIPASPALERGAFPLLVKGDGGPLRVSSSKRGRPIVSGPNMQPGDVVRGQVRVENAGEDRGKLSLSRRGLSDVPGPNGGRLSTALSLRIMRVRPKPARPHSRKRTVWEGSLSRMPKISLGEWRPGKSRRYRFRIELPDGGLPPSPTSEDNAYQGSSAKVGFVWTARA